MLFLSRSAWNNLSDHNILYVRRFSIALSGGSTRDLFADDYQMRPYRKRTPAAPACSTTPEARSEALASIQRNGMLPGTPATRDCTTRDGRSRQTSI